MPAVVSAFAARRSRAQAAEVVTQPEALAIRELSAESLTISSSVNNDDSESDESVLDDENSFAVLSGAQSERYLTHKRIFELKDGSIRIELLKDQSIVVLGLCTIWIRSGEINVYGARLQASPEVNRLYAPLTHALPQITAFSNADFVLASNHEDELHELQRSYQRPIWDVPGNADSVRSFHIVSIHQGLYSTIKVSYSHSQLGYSLQYDDLLRKRLKLLDSTQWLSALRTMSKPVDSARDVLVCGSRSTGKSTFGRVLINCLVTEHSQGALLLDLDVKQPELAPPGIVYLAYVGSPLLGPPISHLATPRVGRDILTRRSASASEETITGTSGQNHILRMHYIGSQGFEHSPQFSANAVADLIQCIEGVRSLACPLIVNSPGGFQDADELVSLLHKKIPFSDIACLDHSASSRYKKLMAASREKEGCAIHEIQSKAHRGAPASTIQWSHLQSYFHMINLKSRVTWDPLALLSTNRTELGYGDPDSLLWAIITLGEQLALENVAQALEGSIVALVAVSQSGATSIRRTIENLPYRQVPEDDESGLPDPRCSECLGLAYVVNIDTVRETVEILTPVSLDELNAHSGTGNNLALVLGRQNRLWAPP